MTQLVSRVPRFMMCLTLTQLVSRTVCLRIALLMVLDLRFLSALLCDRDRERECDRELLRRLSVSCKRSSVTETSSILRLSESWRQYTCL